MGKMTKSISDKFEDQLNLFDNGNNQQPSQNIEKTQPSISKFDVHKINLPGSEDYFVRCPSEISSCLDLAESIQTCTFAKSHLTISLSIEKGRYNPSGQEYIVVYHLPGKNVQEKGYFGYDSDIEAEKEIPSGIMKNLSDLNNLIEIELIEPKILYFHNSAFKR